MRFMNLFKQSNTAPFRVGMWCDYHTHSKLPDQEGIGVFVSSMISGLLDQPENVEVVVLVRPGEEHHYSKLVARYPGKLHVLPDHEKTRVKSWRQIFTREYWHEVTKQKLSHSTELRRRVKERKAQSMYWLGNLKSSLRPVNEFSQRLGWFLLAAIRLYIIAAKPVIHLRYLLQMFLVRTQLEGARWIAKRVRPLQEEAIAVGPIELAQQAKCDIWVVPHGSLSTPLRVPAVVFVHDMVTHHFPEIFDPRMVRTVDILFRARSKEAVLVACMSEFIRQADLLGHLQLPKEKTAMVPVVAPEPFQPLSKKQSLSLIGPKLQGKKYILWPAMFRPYKGQVNLIEALHLLDTQYGMHDIELVLTGAQEDSLPPDWEALCQRLKLRHKVHVTGFVNRERLGALYQHAFAVIAPTQFEQGSFPVFEALLSRCPVACSRIPSLVQQCESMGNAMLYFEPNNSAEIAETVVKIAQDREAIILRQAQASKSLLNRSWKDAGGEWLKIFKQAASSVQPPAPADCDFPAAVKKCSYQPRKKVFLFQPINAEGEEWEFTKSLVNELVELNREKGEIDLTLGLRTQQIGWSELAHRHPDLRVELIEPTPMLGKDLQRYALASKTNFTGDMHQTYSFFKNNPRAPWESDAWFSLSNHFDQCLAPLRPYGVMVHDFLNSDASSSDLAELKCSMREGIQGTIKLAKLVVTSCPVASRNVRHEFQISENQVRMIPLAHDPAARFICLEAKRIPNLAKNYILNIAHFVQDRQATFLIRGFSQLRKRPGWQDWQLVLSGSWSDKFYRENPSRQSAEFHLASMQNLARSLGLEPGRDVLFLGFTSDDQLKYLYEKCQIVINAAKHDNGSFSMIEGAWFGKPVVSSRYPAAEFLDERFGIDSYFFRIDDENDFVQACQNARNSRIISDSQRIRRQRYVVRDEVLPSVYCERFYELLVELATGEPRTQQFMPQIPSLEQRAA